MAKSTKGMDKLKAMMMGGNMPMSAPNKAMMNAPSKGKTTTKSKAKPIAKPKKKVKK